MKTASLIPVLLLTACAAAPGPADGGGAPDFSVQDDAGLDVTGRSLWADHDVLLVFMTSW